MSDITKCRQNSDDGHKCNGGLRLKDLCGYHYQKLRYYKGAYIYPTQKQKDEIVKLYSSGLSLSEVAKKVGYSKKTILKYVTLAGISRTSEVGKGAKYFWGKNYQPKTPWARAIMLTKEYKTFRQAVMERDLWTCQLCSYKGSGIQVDHILPKSIYPEKIFDVDNGRVLCVDCHRKTDTYGLKIWHKYLKEKV